MVEIQLAQARESLGELVSQVAYGHERVMLTRHGKQLAAVVSLEDLELIERLEDEIDIAEAHQALADARASGEAFIPLSEIDA